MRELPRARGVSDGTSDTTDDPASGGVVEERFGGWRSVGHGEPKLGRCLELQLGGAGVPADEQSSAQHSVNMNASLVADRAALQYLAIDLPCFRRLPGRE